MVNVVPFCLYILHESFQRSWRGKGDSFIPECTVGCFICCILSSVIPFPLFYIVEFLFSCLKLALLLIQSPAVVWDRFPSTKSIKHRFCFQLHANVLKILLSNLSIFFHPLVWLPFKRDQFHSREQLRFYLLHEMGEKIDQTALKKNWIFYLCNEYSIIWRRHDIRE